MTGVLLAVWWFARHEGRRAGPWIVGLWLGMAAVSLTKGLLGFALPVAVFSAYGLTTAWANRHERRFRPASILQANAWLFNRWSLAAVPLAVLVYLLPFLAATGADGENAGLAMVWRENVKRFVAPHNHLGPVYLYFGAIVVLAAPWSAFLPAALLPSAGRPTTRGDRLARVYFWVVFLVFTASASRRSYYLLPILPAAALLIGRLLTADRAALSRFALPLRRLAWVLFACGAALAGLVLLHPADVLPSPYDRLPPLPHRALAALGWLAALLAVAACVRRRAWCVPVALVGTFVAFGFSFGIVAPAVDDVRTRREFLRDVRKQTDGDPDRLGLYHAVDAVFDLDRNVADYGTPEELAAAASCGKLRWFVTPRRRFEELPFFPIVLLEEPMHAWEADDNRGNKLVLVQAILAPPGATR